MLNLNTIKETINTATFSLPVDKFGFGFSSMADGEVKTMIKVLRSSIFSRKYRMTVVFNGEAMERTVDKEMFEVIEKLVIQHNAAVDKRVEKIKKDMISVSELICGMRAADRDKMKKISEHINEDYDIACLMTDAQNYIQEIGVDAVNNFTNLCSYLEGIRRAL